MTNPRNQDLEIALQFTRMMGGADRSNERAAIDAEQNLIVTYGYSIDW